MSRRPKIDPMFIQCCKEEIADGEGVVIVVPSRDDIPAYEDRFTDEELESVRFEVRTDGARP